MEYKDLHPFCRLRFWNKRHSFTKQDYELLERVHGPLQKGELPWSIYVSILSGVVFVILIAAFNLWPYFTGLFLMVWILIGFIPSRNNRAND